MHFWPRAAPFRQKSARGPKGLVAYFLDPKLSCAPQGALKLLELDSAAGLLELLLHVLGLCLGHAFLDRLGSAVDQVFRFLQAEARQLANDLDHLDLLLTRSLEDDRELVL